MNRKYMSRAAKRKQDEQIVAVYRTGVSRHEVALRLGVNGATVNRVLARSGELREDDGHGLPFSQRTYEQARAKVAKVAHLFGTGPKTSAEDLSKKIGVCAATVRRHLSEMGVKLRTGERKLTAEVVAKIKEDLLGDTLSYTDIAKKHGVKRSSIGGIAKDRVWAHVPWSRPYEGRPAGLLPEERDGTRGIRGKASKRSRRR